MIWCWIVCEKCEDPFYEGHPTGMVFMSETQAKEYIDGHDDLYLERAYVTEET